jgi:homoserine dehydrogenase
VSNIGIDRISDLDLKFARENDYSIKLVARAFKKEGRIFGFVAPQFVHSTHPLAAVRNEYNAVQVEGAFAEKQLFIGKGAGSYPTGSAVLSDVSALTYDYAYEYKKLHQGANFEFSNDLYVEAFVSFDLKAPVSISDFREFKSGYAANGKQYMVGQVLLKRLLQWHEEFGAGIILAPDSSFVPAEVPLSSSVELV